MNSIKICDCTLSIADIMLEEKLGFSRSSAIEKLIESKVDIIDIGNTKIFENEEEQVIYSSKCIFKKSNSLFSVLVNIDKNFLIGKIPSADKSCIDIFKVAFKKKDIVLGITCCKELKKRGYQIAVVLENIEQYSQKEFIDLLKQLHNLSLMEICISNLGSCQLTNEIIQYVKIIDQETSPDIYIGFHGNNSSLNVLGICTLLSNMNLSHDLILESSVNGVSCYSGILNTELIIKYLNLKFQAQYNILPILEFTEKYISKIFLKKPWGFSQSRFLAASYNCDPEYADYFEQTLNLKKNDIYEILSNLDEKDREYFSSDIAEKYLRQHCLSKFHLAIIVPTKNRPDIIRFWINLVGKEFYNYGIDLIFYDSSDDLSTKNLIDNCKLDNILWYSYKDKVGDITLDRKVYCAANKFCKKYDYIWLCRDRSIPQITVVYKHLCDMYSNSCDFAVVYPHYKSPTEYIEKYYDNCSSLLLDLCGEMTSLGSIIFSSNTLENIVNQYPIDEVKNYGLWLPIALFQYLPNVKFKALYFIDNSFFYIPYTSSSFWIKSDTLYWLWSKRWITMIENLPPIYDGVKNDVLKFKNWTLSPFSKFLLVSGRTNGGLTLRSFFKYKKYIKKVANISISKLFCLALTPPKLLNAYTTLDNNLIVKILRTILQKVIRPVREKIKKIVLSIKNSFVPSKRLSYSGVDYAKIENNFEKLKDISSRLFWGDPKKTKDSLITIAIPTNGRSETLSEALESILSQSAVPFAWNVIVVDNNPLENSTLELIKKINNERILYYVNDENLGVCGNINRCVELAQGKWVSFLHDDDLLTCDYLKKIYRRILSVERVSKKPLAYISTLPQHIYQTKNNSKEIKASKKMYDYLFSYRNDEDKIYVLSQMFLVITGGSGIAAPTSGTLVNKNIFIKFGGYNEKNGILEDQIFAYNMMKEFTVCQTKVPMGFYRWFINESINKMTDIAKASYDFREFSYRQNLFTRLLGRMFRQEHFFAEANSQKIVLNAIGKTPLESDYENIMIYKYNLFRNFLFRLFNYFYRKYINATAIDLIDKGELYDK